MEDIRRLLSWFNYQNCHMLVIGPKEPSEVECEHVVRPDTGYPMARYGSLQGQPSLKGALSW